MKGVPILIAVALLVASTFYAQQPQQNGQLPNGAPPSDSPIEPRPRDVPPGGRTSTPAQNVVAVPVPVAPPRPNGPIQKSLVRITATEVAPDYRAPWNAGMLGRGVGAGFVIEGNRIMTNAHVVSNSRYLTVG